jgi:hypothetical protein
MAKGRASIARLADEAKKLPVARYLDAPVAEATTGDGETGVLEAPMPRIEQ